MGYQYTSPLPVTGAQVPGGPHVDFPFLISITDDRFRTFGNGGRIQHSSGFDWRPLDDDGVTFLDHEMESFNGTTGTITAWARKPSMSSTSTPSCTYGNSAISVSQENVTGVWNSAYKGVWHLGEASSPTLDSTSGASSGTQSGGVTFGATGKIGKALSFDGNDDSISLGNTPVPLRGLSAADFSIFTWINPTSCGLNNLGTIIDGFVSAVGGWYMLIRNVSGSVKRLQFGVGSATADANSTTVDNAIALGAWQQIGLVFSHSTRKITIYVNAAVQTLGTQVAAGADPGSEASSPVHIGNHASATDRTFDGLIDELRISNVARSADWITAEYYQVPASGFLTLGAEVALAAFTSPMFASSRHCGRMSSPSVAGILD